MNVIILISRHDLLNDDLKSRIKNNSDVKHYRLGLINGGVENTAGEISRWIRAHTTAEVDIISFAEHLLDHSLSVKDDYIRFISELGNRPLASGKSLKEHFQFPSQQFSVWWLSLVYEKSPPKTDAFLNFVKISQTIRLAQQYSCAEIWLSQAGPNRILYDVLSSAKNLKIRCLGRPHQRNFLHTIFLLGREALRAARHIVFMSRVWLRIGQQKSGSKHKAFPDGCRTFMLTMFPFFDQEKFRQKRFYSKAYGPLQDGLDQSGLPFVWLAMHLKLEPYTWWDSLPLAKQVKQFTDHFFSIDEWIGPKDIAVIVVNFFRFKMRCLKVLGQMPALTAYSFPNGIKVRLWPILREDFISSFAGKALVVNLHYLSMFSNIARELPRNSTLVHFAEMQTWERCLQIACSLRDDIRVIALQHAHVPQLLLNYFDDPQDLKQGDLIHCVPQPAFLGTVGSVTQEYFLRQGWSREKLFIVGGFRFQSLLQDRPAVEPDRSAPYIVAAFCISYNENLEMLRMLQRALNDGRMKLRVFIKSHPAESVEKMAAREKLELNKDVFVFTDEPLEKLMPGALAMFACSTSAIFYAMACRRPVMIPLMYDAVDLCPLTNLYSYGTRIADHGELTKVIGDIMIGRYDDSRLDDLYYKLINDYLCLDKDGLRPFNNLKIYINK